MVPPDSRWITRVLRYSGTCYARRHFAKGAVTLYGRPFQVCFARDSECDIAGPTTPGVSLLPVWPLPRSLAATRGVTVLSSFPPGTEMFHFPGFAP